MAPREDDRYWVSLNMVVGVGKTLFHRLIRALGSPRDVFSASRNEILGVEGVGPKTVDQIFRMDPEVTGQKELDRLEEIDGGLLTLQHPDFPNQLKDIYDPPPVIYYQGTHPNDLPVCLAVVGTRLASSYGKQVAQKLCLDLGRMGITLVSGMARGIDTLVHRAALDSGGSTIAVFGCGLEHTYPPENDKLREAIIRSGCVISEFPLQTRPDRNNFPARNRIISGLSLGTLVIEAGDKSGALITADFALEQGREVFAIPGNIFSPKSKGTHRLIQMGAKLVDSAQAVVEDIVDGVHNLKKSPAAPVEQVPELNERERHILELLSSEETPMDTVIQSSHLSPAEVSATLMQLELTGRIRQTEGKKYIINQVTSV